MSRRGRMSRWGRRVRSKVSSLQHQESSQEVWRGPGSDCHLWRGRSAACLLGLQDRREQSWQENSA